MSIFVVDCESDGPVPHLFSLISFGAVKLFDHEKTFFGQTKPISDKWVPEALAVSNITRETHLTYPDPEMTFKSFHEWVLKTNKSGRPVFISDNPAYDWQWINYYFHRYVGDNPFGFSARRIGDIYSGLKCDLSEQSMWKKYRKTKHTHHPVDDALGNAEALVYIISQFKVKGNVL